MTMCLPVVSAAIRNQAWPVTEVYRGRGNLDAVFRALTARAADTSVRAEATRFTAPVDREQRLSGRLGDLWVICKNELVQYFATPIAYVFVTIFLLALGAFTFFLGRVF